MSITILNNAKLSSLKNRAGTQPMAIVRNLIRHMLVKRAFVAVGPQIELERLGFYNFFRGNVAYRNRREIRLSRRRAHASELLRAEFDNVAAAAIVIRERFEPARGNVLRRADGKPLQIFRLCKHNAEITAQTAFPQRRKLARRQGCEPFGRTFFCAEWLNCSRGERAFPRLFGEATWFPKRTLDSRERFWEKRRPAACQIPQKGNFPFKGFSTSDWYAKHGTMSLPQKGFPGSCSRAPHHAKRTPRFAFRFVSSSRNSVETPPKSDVSPFSGNAAVTPTCIA